MSLAETDILDFRAPLSDAGVMSGVTVKVTASIRELESCWRSFQERAVGTAFQSFEWIDCWFNSESAEVPVSPVIVTAYADDGRPIALLPLPLRRRFGLDVIGWYGAEQGNYGMGLFDADYWGALTDEAFFRIWRRIADALPPADLLLLPNQPLEIAGFRNPLHRLPQHASGDDGQSFSLDDWEAHFKSRFGASSRRKLRRLERRLRERGRLHYEVAASQAEASAALATLVRLKSGHFSAEGIGNFLLEPRNLRFFDSLVAATGSSLPTRPEIHSLKLDDQTLAVALGMRYGDTYFGILLATTGGEFRSHSPGSMLFLRMSERLAAEGVVRLDCGAGLDQHKRRWCSEATSRFTTVVPLSPAGFVYGAVHGWGQALKTHIKTSEPLWRLARRARRWRGLFSATISASGRARP